VRQILYDDFEIFRNKKSCNDVDTLVFCAGEDVDVDIWGPFLEGRFGNNDEMTDGLVMLEISEGVNSFPCHLDRGSKNQVLEE
jgi:hypothetical protein